MYANEKVHILSRAFSYSLRCILLAQFDGGSMGVKAILVEIIEKNKKEPECCASHEFCDSNVAMIEAMTIVGMEHDHEDKEQEACINQAWALAKKRHFYIGEFEFDE